jgi:hypothetical protein
MKDTRIFFLSTIFKFIFYLSEIRNKYNKQVSAQKELILANSSSIE